MLAVLSWWLIMEVLGFLALPLAWRLFCHLPDRGYAFAKPVGLLLTGYVLWMGSSFGFLSNSRSAIVFAMALLGAASAAIWLRERGTILPQFSQNRRLIVATELVFAVALFGWALVRAYNPDIAATEKPMEIAFLNAILRSERFPPHDPWLSGFAISYYYFGYLLMAVLTKLSGVAASIAFNLAISMLFALTAVGAFSLVYNLVATDRREQTDGSRSSALWALLGPLFVVVIGNLEGLFEVLHTRGVLPEAFWSWLDVQGLIEAPVNGRWVPTDAWWWWRASRVVNDRDLRGMHMEVIDEFPQFSFLLGDMHPHVLALPFVLVALGLALNVLLGAREWGESAGEEQMKQEPWWARARNLLAMMWQHHAVDLALAAVCLGALGFLNTWDLPIHLLVVAAAFLLGQRLRRSTDWLMSTAVFTISVTAPAALLYLPFYLGFQSQAGGLLPVFFNVTRVHQYLLMFGLFVFVIGSVVVIDLLRAVRSLRHGEGRAMWSGLLQSVLWLVTAPLLMVGLAVLLLTVTKTGRQFLQGVLADEQVQLLIRGMGVTGLLRQAAIMRLTNPWTFLLIVVMLAAIWYRVRQSANAEVGADEPGQPALLFAYLIAGVAFLLTLIIEFVYLRDLFGTRMNTVFKFYYQAWVMMAIASAWGCYHMVGRSGSHATEALPVGRRVWSLVLAVLVLVALIYPLLAIPNKAGGFKGRPTLDGMAFLQNVRPDDYAAIRWLQDNVSGTAYIVESTGGSYSDASFVSAFTGLPTILGWDFHEFQWRGNTVESGKRQPDIAQIYQSPDSAQVLSLLDKYDIEYVYVGSVEQRQYELPPSVGERFGRFLETVYEGGSVRIYRR